MEAVWINSHAMSYPLCQKKFTRPGRRRDRGGLQVGLNTQARELIDSTSHIYSRR